MKKFAKLVALLAALVLVLSCFVACSNGDDGDDADSASVQALQGLWVGEDDYGVYCSGNMLYEALFYRTTGQYYYNKDEAIKFSVSGNKIIIEDEEAEFAINGDRLTIKYHDEDTNKFELEIYKKVAKTAIGISSEAI